MLIASRLLSRHGHLIGRTSVIVVVALIVLLASWCGALVLTAGLLPQESEPLIAAPLRW